MPTLNPKLTSLVLVVLALLLGSQTVNTIVDISKKYEKSPQEQEKLTISAEGKITASPDVAKINISVVSEGNDQVDLKNEGNKIVVALQEYLKKQGVEDKDILTQNFSLSPKYNWGDGKTMTIDGYSFTQSLQVTLRKLENAGEIVAGLVQEGANDVSQLQYEFSDYEGLKQKARQLALENARQKAEELAKTAGITLGKLITFSEQGISAPPIGPMYAFDIAKGNGPTSSSVSAPIMSGTTDVVATLSVTYALQ